MQTGHCGGEGCRPYAFTLPQLLPTYASNTLQYCKIALPRSIEAISPLSGTVMHYVAFPLIPPQLGTLAHLAHIVHLAQFLLLFCKVNSTSGGADRVALGKCTF